MALRSYYVSYLIRYFMEVAYWSDANTGNYVLVAWLEELRVIAEDATR